MMRRTKKECQRRNSEQSRSNFHLKGTSAMPHIILPLLLLALIVCGIESSRFGVVPPNVYTRLNNTFEVSCYVHGIDGVLNFYDGDTLVDDSLIKRTNHTFITYKNSCTKPIKKNLTCRRGVNIVGTSEIFIDGNIEPVSKFECDTKDLKHLSCGFRQSINIIPNNYNLFYSINDNEKSRVDLEPDFKGGYKSKIIRIDEYDGISSMNFNFSLVAKRMKISEEEFLTENYHFELLEALMPLPVEKIEVNTTNNAASVMLTLPRDFENVTNQLMFNVRLKARDENGSMWTENILSDLPNEGNKVFLSLMDLKYANTFYQFEVRIKSKTSNEKSEKVWSEYREKDFKTKPTQPEKLPRICRNCFSRMDNGNIFIYWMEVPKFDQNGENFGYELRIKNENNYEVEKVRLKKTSHMISHSINASKVEIFSVNALGISQHHRTVHVSCKNSRSILRIKKELFRNFGYKLSWRVHDSSLKDIESYTIVWCKQKNELPNQCIGPITYENVSHNQTKFYLNTTQDSNSLQFGIAVNRANNIVSGFEWAKCTASRPDEIGTIPSIWDDGKIRDTSIEIAWDLNCADENIVKGYNISYCVMSINSNLKYCDEPPIHRLILLDDKMSINKHRLTSLRPYTKYNISVAMISISNRMGPFSKSIMVQTIEGTPTAPRNLTAVDIKDTSVELMWQRPSEINGPSLTYQLWCNEKSFHIDNNETMNEFFYYTLNNLEPFTSYSIRVIAQTRNSSDPSEGLLIKTKVGLPGRISLPSLYDMKNGSLKLEWMPPINLGGHLDFYQLNVSIHRDNNVFQNYSLYQISGRRTSCLVNFGEGDNHEVFFYIRAVNINSEKRTRLKFIASQSIYCLNSRQTNLDDEFYYYGEWSPPIVHLSFYTDLLNSFSSSSLAILVTFCFALSLLSFFSCCTWKFYRKVQKMRDIKAIYPEGLDPNEPSLLNLQETREKCIKDFDLLNSHMLTDIVKEDVDVEIKEKDRDERKDNVSFEPLIKTSQSSDEVFCNSFLIINNKPISLPSPLQGQLLWPANSIDKNYTKMHKPRMANKNDNTTPTEGYLDMSGKSPIRSSPAYTSIEVKNLLENSRENNGYIDRKSIQNTTFPMNVNGYIAFKKT